MIPYLWVALGSAVGGMARYGFGLAAARWWGESFPWGTIAINIAGSFIIGFFGALTTAQGAMPASANIRLFVMVGICGGFTTFSSFSLQTFTLARDGSWLPAMGNVVLSVVLCLLAVTAGQLSAERVGMLRSEAASLPHHILAILDRRETAEPVLAATALVADRTGAGRIEALHVRHGALEDFMPTEEVMTGQRRGEIEQEAAGLSTDLRRAFEAWQPTRPSATWREVAGDTAQAVARDVAGADLLVVGLPTGRHAADASQAVHVALFVARMATLIVPPIVPTSVGRHVAIAWKSSDAANRAIEAALPLLLRAEQVSVLMATEAAHPDSPPGVLLQRLARNGIPTHIHRFEITGPSIGRALLTQAHIAGADLLVMGAYTSGRLREMILGGATREILASADLPVLMQH